MQGKSSLANRINVLTLWDLNIDDIGDAASWHGWIEEWEEEFKRWEKYFNKFVDKERLIKQRVQFKWHVFHNDDGNGIWAEIFTKNLDEDDPPIFIQVDNYPPEIVPFYSQFSKWVHWLIYFDIKLEFTLKFGVETPLLDSDIFKLEYIFTQHFSNKGENRATHIFVQDQTILIIESYKNRNNGTIKGKYKDQSNQIFKKISEVVSIFPSNLKI